MNCKKKKNSTSYSMNYIIMSYGSVLSFFVYFSVSLSYMYINILYNKEKQK